MSFKHFSKFDRNFIRQNETCPHCHKELDRVALKLSNRQELFVRCESKGCKGYTLAERKPTAKGVLNKLVMCL